MSFLSSCSKKYVKKVKILSPRLYRFSKLAVKSPKSKVQLAPFTKNIYVI